MMYDVFISCTSTEVRIAERLSAYLEYYNIQCFVANRDIPADVPWAQGIAEAIRNSRLMVALFSEDFNSGTWMDDELKTAVNAGVPILTFRLSNVAYGESKAPYLKSTIYIDATNDIEGNFPKLYEEVCNMLGFPIEQALPVDEVLVVAEQANNVVQAEKSSDPVAESEKSAPEKVNEVQKVPSHNLFSAVLIGLGLTVAMVLFLEWILK